MLLKASRSCLGGLRLATKLPPLANSYVAVNILPAIHYTASALYTQLPAPDTTAMFDYMISATDRVTALVNRMLTERSLPFSVFPDADLRAAGLGSLDIVNLVLSVESEFDVSIPDADITPARFQSITSIATLITTLLPRRDVT
jgi:acyl carrier protein